MNIRPCAVCASSARTDTYLASENICSGACNAKMAETTLKLVALGEQNRLLMSHRHAAMLARRS